MKSLVIDAPHSSYFLVIGLTLLAGACREMKTGDSSAVDAKASDVDQLTEEECVEFAKSLEEMVRSGDLKAFQQAIDWDDILSRAIDPSKASEAIRALFRSGAKQSLTADQSLTGMIVSLTQSGGDFRCLRIRTEDGSKRAVFRLLILDRYALDYFDFLFSRRADGKIVVTDIDDYRSGETVSENVRRDYESRTASYARIKQTGRPRDLQDAVENEDKFGEMQLLARSDPRRALELYSQLPTAMQNERRVLFVRIDAANQLEGPDYDRAAEEIARLLPNDRCLDILLPNYYLAHQKYDEYRSAMDRLDTRTGGDPYLNFRRALSYFAEKKLDLAAQLARKAVDAEDTLTPAYMILLEIAITTKEFDEVSRLLTMMEDKELVEFADLTKQPFFTEFVKSPQYDAWLKRTKRK